MTRSLLCLPLLSWIVVAPSRSAASPQAAPASGAAAKTAGSVDACTLLTSAEIQAAVGESLAEARPSSQLAGKIQTAQCLFRTPTFAKSISVTVATPGLGTTPAALREFWRNQFHPTPGNEKEEDVAERGETRSAAEAELERAARKARAISGLGDEAFWVGSPITGALYVLERDAFLRVSVGGIPEESSRLEKAKIVASAAAGRLRSILLAPSGVGK